MNIHYTVRSLTLASALLIPSALLAELHPQANEKGKYGYADETGAFVIQPQYDMAQPFFQGRAIVGKGHAMGLIDEQNQPVLPIKYNVLNPVDDSTYMIAVDGRVKDGQLVGEKYGFASATGEIIVKPEYIEMSPFNQFGLASIRHKNGKCGFIDTSYHIAIPVEFDFTGSFNSKGVTWLNKGGAPNENGKIRGGRFYIINAQGNMFIPGEYNSIGFFELNSWKPSEAWLNNQKGTAKRLWRDGKPNHYFWKKYYMDTAPGSRIPTDAAGFWGAPTPDGYYNGVFDTDGNMLIEPGKYYTALLPEDGIALICDKNSRYNYLNVNTGAMVLTKDIDDGCGFHEGYAVCTVKPYMYIVDTQGGCRSDGYDCIYPAVDGMHIVAKNNSYGIIGTDGHEIVPCSAPDIWPVKCGKAIVKVGTSYAYADNNGYATTARFVNATNFLDGYAWADEGNGWHLFDSNFRQISKSPFKNGGFKAGTGLFRGQDKNTGKWQYYKISDGSAAFSNTFTDTENFGGNYEGVALAADSGNNSWGVVDAQGKNLIPHVFSKELAILAYEKFLQNDRPWTYHDSYMLNLHNNPLRHKYLLTSRIDDSMWDY